MEEYILDDGRINLGPQCTGAVEFEDGHFEPVTNIKFITKTHFQFTTTSGLYAYKEGVEWETKLYCDDDPYTYGHMRYTFAKYDFDKEEWIIMTTIARVYVYKPAFSILEEDV